MKILNSINHMKTKIEKGMGRVEKLHVYGLLKVEMMKNN